VLIKSIRVKGTRAGIDCRAAGTSDTLLTVVGRRGADVAKGGDADECATSPRSDIPSDPHECPRYLTGIVLPGCGPISGNNQAHLKGKSSSGQSLSGCLLTSSRMNNLTRILHRRFNYV
jgi:hypothetical protein